MDRRYGLPGQYLTTGNPYARLLLRNAQSANNGTHLGGLASALSQGVLGYLQGQDRQAKQKAKQDEAAAYSAMAQGFTPSTETPMGAHPGMRDAAQPSPGGYQGASQALMGLQDNPYAGRLASQLAMKQNEINATKDLKKWEWENAPQKLPPSVQEYEYAKKNGYTGSFEEFKRSAGAGQETYGNSPIWATDQQGNPVLVQVSNRGNAKPVNLPQGVTPQRGQTKTVDLGDKIGVLDANGMLIGYQAKGIGPDRQIKDGQIITLPAMAGGQTPIPDGGPSIMQAGGMPGTENIPPQNMGQAGVSTVALPPSPEEQRKTEEQDKSKGALSQTLSDMVNSYLKLKELGGVVDPDAGALDNAQAWVGATGFGQAIGSAFGTEEASIRQRILNSQPALINAIRQATGMSAKGMDSNAELQFFLQQATNPQKDIISNLAAIDALDRTYGLGGVLKDTLTPEMYKRVRGQAELLKKKAPAPGAVVAEASDAPEGVDPKDWKFMTPEQKALFQ